MNLLLAEASRWIPPPASWHTESPFLGPRLLVRENSFRRESPQLPDKKIQELWAHSLTRATSRSIHQAQTSAISPETRSSFRVMGTAT